MGIWRYFIWLLTWLAGDPVAIDQAAARASAAVTMARSSMQDEKPAPKPEQTPDGKPRR